MNKAMLLLLLLATGPTQAALRPEPARPEVTRRASEIPRSLSQKIETMNRTVREVLGQRVSEGFEIRIPEGLSGNKMNRYERDLNEFARTLRDKKTEIMENGYKGTEIANFLELLNQVFAQRNHNQNFLQNQRLSSEQRAVVQRNLDFIDNLLTIEMAKITETADSPLSQGVILRTMYPISRMPVAQLKIQDFIDVEAQITAILPKNYNMAKAASCVR